MSSRIVTVPNLLTVFRMVLIPVFVSLLFYQRFILALAIFILAGITDGLDGLLARRFDQKSQLGTILDPIADKLLLVTSFVVLSMGAPSGDLHIITNVGQHKYFTRKGDNIYVTVPITVPEAALGAKIEVPTVDGKTQLRVPPGTQSGQKFRLRERGAPSLRNPGAKGHQFVEVQVTLPKVISEETKELLREYSKLNTVNPRVEMGLE